MSRLGGHSEAQEPQCLNLQPSLPDEVVNLIEEVGDLAKQTLLDVDSDDVRELLDFLNQELAMNELIEMHDQKQGIQELEALNPVQSEH
ncbi:hypothetical protein TNCV_3012081 [Trichonephila clavipes]|nr:hypothetical protein TNCV_3012081 [Trichonephila clavipes]